MVVRGCFGLLLLTMVGAVTAQEAGRLYDGKTISEWTTLLKSKEVNERRAAAFYLNRAGAGAASGVQSLIAALDDPDETVRVFCARALGNVGKSARPAIPSLIKSLGAGPNLRRSASASLAKLGPDAVKPLCLALDDENPSVRSASSSSLALMGRDASSAAPALAKRLSDPSFRVRRSVALALAMVEPKPDDVLPALLTTLKTDNDADVCRAAATALGKLGKPAIPAIMKALGSDSPELQYHAAGALQQVGSLGSPAVKPLVGLLKSDDAELRLVAAAALAAIGEAAISPLIQALQDANKQVRVAAAMALGNAAMRNASGAAKEAIKPLTEALESDDLALRRAAAKSLAEYGSAAKVAIEPLIRAMKNKDLGIREPATIALLRIGKDAVPSLIAVLKESTKDAELRLLSVVALGAIGREASPAVPQLTRALRDSNSDVRFYAARALGGIGTSAKSALKELETALTDDDLNVRAAAGEAIRQIRGLDNE